MAVAVGTAAVVAIGGLFLGLLWEVIISLAPEMDLWWYIPTVLRHVEGKSAGAVLLFILQPAHVLVTQPPMKLFTWLIHGWLQWPFSSMVLSSVLFHMANAGLLFWVGRRLGLSHRSSIFSALLYLTMFVHFHAYLWPIATQHLFSLFGLLGTLGLYLKTEEKMRRREGDGPVFYCFTGLAACLASTQRSTLFILPIIAADLWVTSTFPQERKVRYDRWMPLFLLVPIYSILDLALVGDRVTTMAISESGLPAVLKVGFLFAGVLTCVAMGRWLIRTRFAPQLVGAAVLVGFLFLFPLRDKRQILFAYNALVPFSTVLGSFLDPFRVALQMDSTIQYYLIPAQVSGFLLLLSLLLWVLFWVLVVRGQKRMSVLFVWYAACLCYIFLHPHAAGSFPVQIVSRYFIYFTPVVAWIVSSVLVALFDLLVGSSRARRTAQGLLLGSLVGACCLANLLAIRVAIFRGRFYNTYGIYDDIRIAHLIGDDLARLKAKVSSNGKMGVYVDRMVPLHYVAELGRHLPAQGMPFDNFRLLALDALRGLPVEGLHVNLPPPYPEGARVFRIVGTQVEDAAGRGLDPFSERFERGLAEYAQGRTARAGRSLQQAARVKPFLLRYLLGPCRLSDVRWLTQGRGLREWLEEVVARYQVEQSVGPVKQRQTAAVVKRELFDYAVCLLHLAYLKDREGFQEESRYWLYQLRFLEPDPEFLVEWLGQHPRIQGTPGMKEFLRRAKPSLQGRDPLSGSYGNGEFGRFLGRLILHWDEEGGEST